MAIKQLEDIGMIWDYEEYRNRTELSHAEQFYKEYGHLNIPKDIYVLTYIV